jgi:peroxiredoxin
MGLRDDLSSTARELRSGWPGAVREAYDRSVADLRDSGLLDGAVQAGEMVPEFLLADETGRRLSLPDLLDRGPVIVVFFLSADSPLCRLTLATYRRTISPHLHVRDACLLAVSLRPGEEATAAIGGSDDGVHLLSDPDGKVCGLFGLLYTPPEPVADGLRRLGVRLPLLADGRHLVPLAACYVVDADGIATWARVDVDPAVRAEPEAILAALEQLAPVLPGAPLRACP